MENENQNQDVVNNVSSNQTTATTKPNKNMIIGIVAVVAVVAIVVVVVMLMGKGKIAGKYTLVEAEENGQKITKDMLSLFGLTGEMELKEDKTGTISIYGNNSDLTYDDKNITVQGSAAPYTFSDGKITIDINGTKMVFEKK